MFWEGLFPLAKTKMGDKKYFILPESGNWKDFKEGSTAKIQKLKLLLTEAMFGGHYRYTSIIPDSQFFENCFFGNL